MATYIRLTDYKDSDSKEQGFFKSENRYEAKQDDFEKIPGSPIAYWVSNEYRNIFENNKIYMHDSEYFDITLNCVSISLENLFNNELNINNIKLETPKNLHEIFTQLNIFIINLENEISGGLTLVNFDYELDKLLSKLNIEINSQNELFLLIQSLF